MESRIGAKFGLLTIVGRSEIDNGGRSKKWTCHCQCGNFKDVEYSSLKRGLTKSCGCLNKQMSSDRIKKFNEDFPERISALHENNKGKHMPPGDNFAGPNNIHGKYWCFLSPAGVQIEGFNLSNLIRENAHLFNEDDTKLIKGRFTTVAWCGLTGLHQMKKDGSGPRTNSWKGWTIGKYST